MLNRDRDIKSYAKSFVEAPKKIKIQKRRKLCKAKSFSWFFFVLREEYNLDADTDDSSKTYLFCKLNRKTTRIVNCCFE